MARSICIGVSVPLDLLSQIDSARQVTEHGPLTRSAYLRRALKSALTDDAVATGFNLAIPLERKNDA